MTLTLSLCMIVRNEEDNLPRCLNSAAGIFDEIVIVDTGSTDGTVEIAKGFTDAIFYFEWVDDFAAARNFSFSKATCDYIMWLDADDVLEPPEREKMIRLKKTMSPRVNGVGMAYHYIFDANGNLETVVERDRIVKRGCGAKWVGAVHEYLDGYDVSGDKFLKTDVIVTHKHKTDAQADAATHRNLLIIEKAVKSGKANAREWYYYTRMLNQCGRHAECAAAIECFKKIYDPARDGTHMARAYISAHESYAALGDADEAFKILAENEGLMSDKSEFYCALGQYFRDAINDVQTACDCYARALSCKGREPSGEFMERNEAFYYYRPYLSLAHLFASVKAFDSAQEYAQKALEYKPNDPAAMEMIGLIRQLQEKAGAGTGESGGMKSRI